jgi:hypothetical protein
MLGYKILLLENKNFNFETHKKLIIDSIDRGMPVITVEGVINCSDACVISGYDNDGNVLLGYNPFMYIEDDHNEAPDDTGYFRKTDWHKGCFSRNYGSSVIIIKEKCEKPDSKEIFNETKKLVSRLIREEKSVPGQHNGLSAHRAFANALLTYEWTDNFEPYLNLMCNYKQYLDRQYAVKFFHDNNRNDLAAIYSEISELSVKLGQIIPQDFSAGDMFSDKANLKLYCDILLEICNLEHNALKLLAD